jgi:hypothetical protein
MEGSGSMGTPMTAGVAAPVSAGGGVGNSEGFASKSPTVSNAQQPTSISEYREHEEQATSIKPEIDQAEISENQPPISENHPYADELFETAKKDGVDAAFDKLAHDEPKKDDHSEETDEAHEESVDQPKEEVVEGEEEEEDTEEKEVRSDETDQEENRGEARTEKPIDFMQERVNELEERVAELLERNEELEDKIKAQEKDIRLALETSLAMAQILEALLAGKKEDEEDKEAQGLLALLVKLIAKLLIRLTTPEKDVDEIEKKLDAA